MVGNSKISEPIDMFMDLDSIHFIGVRTLNQMAQYSIEIQLFRVHQRKSYIRFLRDIHIVNLIIVLKICYWNDLVNTFVTWIQKGNFQDRVNIQATFLPQRRKKNSYHIPTSLTIFMSSSGQLIMYIFVLS